jgi:GPI mannosyltransferase 2
MMNDIHISTHLQMFSRRLWRTLAVGLLTRVIFYLLICFADVVIPDHEAQGVTRVDVGSSWLRSFSKWDSAYYLRISLQGYQEEKDFAFFPLYPLLISCGMTLAGLHSIESAISSALLLNTLCFLLTIIVLWRLLETIPGLSEDQIFFALHLFIFSPSSVFSLSVYTESLFALLSFSGMLSLQLDQTLMASLCFSLASLTRSNGIFSVVFILSHALCSLLSTRLSWRRHLRTILSSLGVSLLTSLPYLLHSSFAFASLCPALSSSPDPLEDRCAPQEATGELCASNGVGAMAIYPALQSKHWGVGLLKQYHWRQIPNFLLALPVLVLATSTLSWTLLPLGPKCPPNSLPLLLSLLPFSLHTLALVLVLALAAHIQISTRVLFSSTPLLFLALALLLSPPPASTPRDGQVNLSLFSPPLAPGSVTSWILSAWLVSFLLGGLLLHTNHFPWT